MTSHEPRNASQPTLWILMVIGAIVIGLYPGIYFVADRKFGLLSSKPEILLQHMVWNIGFYTHILAGGVALLIGWAQFSLKFRQKYLTLHRKAGILYVLAAVLSSIAGIGIGFFATGGLISAAGFIFLGVIWFYTTVQAFLAIKNKNTVRHEMMMVYGYAACFAAVTLRIWLPLLILGFGDFLPAYQLVAWLSWVPNLFVAWWINRSIRPVQS